MAVAASILAAIIALLIWQLSKGLRRHDREMDDLSRRLHERQKPKDHDVL